MNDLFGNSKSREEWSVILTYPKAMIPRHATTFCGWSSKLRGTLAETAYGKDTKDDDCEVVIQRFEFDNYVDTAEFCRYTRAQFKKWSGPGRRRRFKMRIRGRVDFDDKTAGHVGASHSTSIGVESGQAPKA
jgi:hypothetical protein